MPGGLLLSRATTARARVAALSRDHQPGDPILESARTEYHAAKLAETITRTISQHPLTRTQRLELVDILLADGAA